METMLNHNDSPYIRAIGFLYLRFSLPPKDLWDWFFPYFDDQEQITLDKAKKRILYVSPVRQSSAEKSAFR